MAPSIKPSQKSPESKEWRRMATNWKEAGAKQSRTLWISSVARAAQRMVRVRELEWDPYRDDSRNAPNARKTTTGWN